MNPNQRYLGSEKQAVFESFVDQFFREFQSLSRQKLLELKQATENENKNYLERRQRSVGTRYSRKVGGHGTHIIMAPSMKGYQTPQRHLIDKYEETHFEEQAKILAKLDAINFLLDETKQ